MKNEKDRRKNEKKIEKTNCNFLSFPSKELSCEGFNFFFP